MRKVLFAFCLGAGLAWGEVGFRDSVIRRANEETGKGGKGGKGEAGCDVDGGGPTQIELLSSDDRDCRLFTSLVEEGSFAAGQVLLLTDLTEGCPCAESEVRLNTLDFSSDVSVCGSWNDHGFLAYQNYCAEQYSSVQNALNGNIYKAAYAEFVDLVERLAQDEALSANEKYQQTQQASDALPSTDNTYSAKDCLDGCARFVAGYCCEDSIFV